MYVSPIDDVVRAHQVHYHQYADDLMLYTALTPSMFYDISSITECTDDVSAWFMENALLLNPGKTEAVIFGTRRRLAGGLDVAGSTVQFSDALKLLGVTLDATLSFDKHVTVTLVMLLARAIFTYARYAGLPWGLNFNK